MWSTEMFKMLKSIIIVILQLHFPTVIVVYGVNFLLPDIFFFYYLYLNT